MVRDYRCAAHTPNLRLLSCLRHIASITYKTPKALLPT
jgi:hypothetical protein